MNTLSRSGAARLAARIEHYWSCRGVSGVHVWIEPFVSNDEPGEPSSLYHVRSNIVERLRNVAAHRDALLRWSSH